MNVNNWFCTCPAGALQNFGNSVKMYLFQLGINEVMDRERGWGAYYRMVTYDEGLIKLVIQSAVRLRFRKSISGHNF